MSGSNRWFVIVPGSAGAEEMGQEVAADMIAIEPSGAVTFWDHVIVGERQALVVTFGHGFWKSIHRLAAVADDTPEDMKEAAQR